MSAFRFLVTLVALNLVLVVADAKAAGSHLARLKVEPGATETFVSPQRSRDFRLVSGKVNGKPGLLAIHEKVGPNAYNFYWRGVVVKLRQRHRRLKMFVVNTSPDKVRVGVRYKL